MGVAQSVVSPPDRDERPAAAPQPELVLHCFPIIPGDYQFVTPALPTDEYAESIAEYVLSIHWQNTAADTNTLNMARFRKELHDLTPEAYGSFTVIDPQERFYCVYGVEGPVDVYFCDEVESPPGLDVDYPGSIIVVERAPARSGPVETVGDYIFGTVLGLSRSGGRPRGELPKVLMLAYDDSGRVKVIPLAEYKPRISFI